MFAHIVTFDDELLLPGTCREIFYLCMILRFGAVFSFFHAFILDT